MQVDLSEQAGNAMLDSLADMMNAGTIEIMSNERVLAVLRLSIPAAMPASGGELEMNAIIEEDAALADGVATTARIVAANGDEILGCDVGDMESDAVIKLKGTTKIYRGQPVQLKSFRFKMP